MTTPTTTPTLTNHPNMIEEDDIDDLLALDNMDMGVVVGGDEDVSIGAAHDNAYDDDTNEFLDWLDQDEASPASVDEVLTESNVNSVDVNLDVDDSFDFDKDVLGETSTLEEDRCVEPSVEEEDHVQNVTTMDQTVNDITCSVNQNLVEKNFNADFDIPNVEDNDMNEEALNDTPSLEAIVEVNKQADSKFIEATADSKLLPSNEERVEISSVDIDNIQQSSSRTIVDNKTHEQSERKVTERKLVSFSDLIRSNISSLMDIKEAYSKISNDVLDSNDRPYLWTRLICGKTLESVQTSSMADSLNTSSNQIDHSINESTKYMPQRFVSEILALMPNLSEENVTREILALIQSSSECWSGYELILATISATIIAAGIKSPVSAVVMRNIIPTFVPLMGLECKQRIETLRKLHKEFYLLACYHLPLLVQHLDRFVPGWYWPKDENEEGNTATDATKIGRNLQAHGAIPVFWFASCFGGSSLQIESLILLWDKLLCSSDPSFKFFLGLSMLEKHAGSLLLVKGSDVRIKLDEVMLLKNDTEKSSFHPEEFIKDWIASAETLRDSSPHSILRQLSEVEDNAIASNSKTQEEIAEHNLQETLRKEAEEKRALQLAEELQKSEIANHELNKKRLQAYYKKFNPGKDNDVEKILTHYKGRLAILDRNLASKYGEGFDPILPTRGLLYTLSEGKSNFMSSMKSMAEKAGIDESHVALLEKGNVSFRLSASDVIPTLFSRKDIAHSNVGGNTSDNIKYVLVDARSRERSSSNGRFPTAISVNPAMLLDPESLQEVTEMFENIRGSVHICIMGDGFSVIPDLFGIRLNDEAKNAAIEDHANVNLCALLMIKKGFPFVSVLDGGFAAAHSWLFREGPSHSLDLENLLIEYDETSEWMLLEKNYKDRCEHQSVVDIEGKSSILSTMRTEIAQRNMLTSVSRLVKRREKTAIDISTMVDSTANFFSKKDVKEESKSDSMSSQNQATLQKGSPTNDDPLSENTSSSFLLKKPFKNFSFNIKKTVPSSGSMTDGSSIDSTDELQPNSVIAPPFEKKSMFGGFTRRKPSNDTKTITANKVNTDIFKKNPFASFGKSKWSKRSDDDTEEISFGMPSGNDVSAFDIGNLSDDDEN